MPSTWVKEFCGAITVCDREGRILEMNDKAAMTFEHDGGQSLVGKSVYDCHPPAAIEKIKEIMKTGKPHAYTIEKKGVKKLIYQTPWHANGEIKGIMELSLEIPFDMPHFVRK